jgi:hypothetical protein
MTFGAASGPDEGLTGMPEGQTLADRPAPAGGGAASRAGGGTLTAFTITTFLSALLLFSVQPMFAKMVLPVLGGSPSVWAVAMCFFQAALLAGYCYAHLLIAKLPIRAGGFVHIAVSLLAFVVLPIAVPTGLGEPPAGEPYFWQLQLFAVAVGLPFVAVAANAPLIQAWFAATGHRHASDPYFLYAASNLGSLIALLAYPFVLEPAFGVSALSGYWTAGYGLLVVCLAGLVWRLARGGSKAEARAGSVIIEHERGERAPTWGERAAWVGLALVPSALLTAFTTHVTTDVASAPLLWVLPLALYLLTFVLVFRTNSLLPRSLLLPLHLASVVVALLVMSQTRNESWFVTAPVGVLAFFTSAMVAHRTLYELRPAARHLTEFYLWMSLGGALGGLATALIAPRIFPEVFEYPLLLALSMACRPGAMTLAPNGDNRKSFDELLIIWLLVAFGILAIYWVPWLIDGVTPPPPQWPGAEVMSRAAWWISEPLNALYKAANWVLTWNATPIVAGLLAVLLVANWRHPPRQLMAAMLIVMAVCWLPSGVKRGDAKRSYFGVYRVMLSLDGQWNTLVHGTTLHGAQRVRDSDGNQVADINPATYYYEASPMARSVVTTREAATARGQKGRFGVIGLGTGSLACYALEGERWRFFEIDPLMIDIAVRSDNFTFMQNCQPNADIVIGDARLTLGKEPDGSYDLIIVDAFSSDAVPVHLMTAEALALYMSKLKPDGVALLHISNRYLDLDTVLAATVKAVPGLHGILVSDDSADGTYAQSSSTVALFARTPELLEKYRDGGTPSDFAPTTQRAWTDDYSDILGPFMSKYRKRFAPRD